MASLIKEKEKKKQLKLIDCKDFKKELKKELKKRKKNAEEGDLKAIHWLIKNDNYAVEIEKYKKFVQRIKGTVLIGYMGNTRQHHRSFPNTTTQDSLYDIMNSLEDDIKDICERGKQEWELKGAKLGDEQYQSKYYRYKIEWCQNAANKGNGDACLLLGDHYNERFGPEWDFPCGDPRNSIEVNRIAYKWYCKGTFLGHIKCRNQYNYLNNYLKRKRDKDYDK